MTKDTCWFYRPVLATILALLLYSSQAGAVTAANATTVILDPAQLQPVSSGQLDAFAQKYVLCFNHSGTTWSAKTDLLKGLTVECTPARDINGEAIKAGERVAIITNSDAGTSQCPTVSISVNSQSVPSVDPYPVRGATAAAAPAGTSKAMTSKDRRAALLAAANTTFCYVVLPGALAADTLNTIKIDASPAPSGASNPYATSQIMDIHTYYRFGVSTAVVLNNIRTNSYGYTPSSTGVSGTTPGKFTDIPTSSVRTFDPVLFLTYYVLPVDTEKKVHFGNPSDWAYGLTVGLSEKAPTTNFYLGASVEPIRNIAIIFGASVISVARLEPEAYDSGPSASHLTPLTTNRFKVGAFVGLSFNFSNFLTSTIFK